MSVSWMALRDSQEEIWSLYSQQQTIAENIRMQEQYWSLLRTKKYVPSSYTPQSTSQTGLMRMRVDSGLPLLHDGTTLHKETTLYQTMINFKYFITVFVANIFMVPRKWVSLILRQKRYVLERTLLKYTLLNEPRIWIFFLHCRSQKQESFRSFIPAWWTLHQVWELLMWN